jgi:peptidoglycan/LPS O-acetylase OafA/YrhL
VRAVKGGRVSEIDLLRLVAALSVVFFHYAFRGYAADGMTVMPYPLLAPVAKYGAFGVELFFMISGFVILMTASAGSLRTFLVSRVVRLYPAFWVCCTITFLATLAIGAPRYTATWSQYLVNMTMLSEFLDVKSVDGVYWSLFVEMRFYALVSLVLVIGRIRQAQVFLALWLAAAATLVALDIDKFRTLLIVDHAAFFIAGATFYLVWAQGPTMGRAVLIALSWVLALYQTTHGLPRFGGHYHTVMSGPVVAGLISSYFVAMLLVSLRRTGPVGRRSWLMAGAVTYPLYLLHENIGFMVFNRLYPVLSPHGILWGTTAAVLLAAYGVHVLVERPYARPMKAAVNRVLDGLADRVQGMFPGPGPVK